MTALAGPRNTSHFGAGEVILTMVDIPLKAGAKVYKGGLVCLDATGYGVAGATATGLRTCGVCDPQTTAASALDNTAGANGTIIARVAQGVFRFANADGIAQVDVGNVAYVVDDQTVAKGTGGATRSPAGIIMVVDGNSVFVSVGLQFSKLLGT